MQQNLCLQLAGAKYVAKTILARNNFNRVSKLNPTLVLCLKIPWDGELVAVVHVMESLT